MSKRLLTLLSVALRPTCLVAASGSDDVDYRVDHVDDAANTAPHPAGDLDARDDTLTAATGVSPSAMADSHDPETLAPGAVRVFDDLSTDALRVGDAPAMGSYAAVPVAMG